MQEKNLYEYAVIRVVPRVERQEFINVGIIIYCAKLKYLDAEIALNKNKIEALAPDMDMEMLLAHLQAYANIAKGSEKCGPIAALDIPSRFRWLTATRSTIIQSSKVHPGFSSNLKEIKQRLMTELVL